MRRGIRTSLRARRGGRHGGGGRVRRHYCVRGRPDGGVGAAFGPAADRPYLVLVTAEATGEPPFMAEVANPTAS